MTRHFAIAAIATAFVLAAGQARAQDANAKAAEATYKEIEQAIGFVPEFVKAFPKASIAGTWQQEKDLELSDKTALSPKVKALISLAVAAQIPCQYCIYADTLSAKGFGASEEEIKEAVAMAALTRSTSTVLNGMQVDLPTFKKETDRMMTQK